MVQTTTTGEDGNYQFSDLLPGDYQVRQTNLTGYGSVSDSDDEDPDLTSVTLSAGETNSGNNFVDELARITGTVLVDDDDNDQGDRPLEGVELDLLNSSGEVIETTTTKADGSYQFSDLLPGDYQVRQTNLTGYGSVSDSDGGDADLTNVTLTPGETVSEQNFVDELARITGRVLVDDNDDDEGDRPLDEVTVELLDSNGDVVQTATTGEDGNYQFSDLLPKDYQVRETNPDGYGDVSDSDDGENLSLISLNLSAGETASEQNFVDELARITGRVLVDDDDDGTGDRPLEGVELELLDGEGNPIDSDPNTDEIEPTVATTDESGSYQFSDLNPGDYQVSQTNLTGYGSVSDSDGEDPDLTSVTLTPGETNAGNDFVDELARITGTVFEDTDNDDIGDRPLEGVELELLDGDGNPIDSDSDTEGTQPTITRTGESGSYQFSNLNPGDYQVRETNLNGYGDVSDRNGGDLNVISVNLTQGETDSGNDFVDEELGALSGNVSQDTTGNRQRDTLIEGVTLTLVDDAGNTVGETETDESGNYSFDNLSPGIYTVVETQPEGLINISETDGGDDEDRLDNAVNNEITALVSTGENDTGNNFVETEPAVISGRVWVDLNGDGLEGESEPAVEDVTVTLIYGGEDGLISTSEDNTQTSVVTDNNGEYEFTGLIPGDEYRVSFDTDIPAAYSDGLTTQNVGDDDAIDSDAEVGTGDTLIVTLLPGETRSDIDAGLISSIEGTASPDVLVGTQVGETIAGYKGQDTITGGEGNDNFFYSETSDGVDIITDFNSEKDRIILTQILEDEVEYTGTDAIADGYVVIEQYDSVGTMIQIDFDAGGELLPKDVVFLDGVFDDNFNAQTDLAF